MCPSSMKLRNPISKHESEQTGRSNVMVGIARTVQLTRTNDFLGVLYALSQIRKGDNSHQTSEEVPQDTFGTTVFSVGPASTLISRNFSLSLSSQFDSVLSRPFSALIFIFAHLICYTPTKFSEITFSATEINTM